MFAFSDRLQLPPGFRFYPSDEELIVHYLKNKTYSTPLPASIIADIHLYKYNPWELPNKALFGEDEWFFFSPRDRKYPNGVRPNRAAASGYWKATGTDKPILTSCGTKSVGVKKALVFYKGRPPKGIKTDWIMQEYRLLDTIVWKQKGSMRLDDWVLCRVRQKNSIPKNTWEDRNSPSSQTVVTGDSTNNVNEKWPLDKNSKTQLANNSLLPDCPLLPYIFASEDLPCMETIATSISFQNSGCGNHNNFGTNNPRLSVSCFHSLFNPLKRKNTEEQNLAPAPCRKLRKEEMKDIPIGHDGFQDISISRALNQFEESN